VSAPTTLVFAVGVLTNRLSFDVDVGWRGRNVGWRGRHPWTKDSFGCGSEIAVLFVVGVLTNRLNLDV